MTLPGIFGSHVAGHSPSSSTTLSYDALNELKHTIIGNQARKLEVLRDDPALVQQLVALCRASTGESSNNKARRLEAVIIVGSLSHAGPASIPTLLSLPPLLPNLFSSLVAVAQPSLANHAGEPIDVDPVRLKGLTAVLQSFANAVGSMCRWVEKERWGSGVDEDDDDDADGAVKTDEQEAEWRAAVGRRVGEFLEGPTPTFLASLLPSSLSARSSTQPALPTRTLLPLLSLLSSLASFSAQTQGALLSAPPPDALFKGKGRSTEGEMDTGDANDADSGLVHEGKDWVESRVKETVRVHLAAGQRAGRADCLRVVRAGLELLAGLVCVDEESTRVNPAVVVDALSNADEGVRYGATHAYASLASDPGRDWSNEHWASFFTAILALWVDIPTSLAPTAITTAVAAPGSKPIDPHFSGLGKALTEAQIRAVFLLGRAIKSRLQVQTLMIEMGVLRRLGELLAVGSGDDVEWRELRNARGGPGQAPGMALDGLDAGDEGELGENDRSAHARIREGILLVLATVALTSTQYHSTLLLLPTLIKTTLFSLGHPTPAVRAAACQLVRGLSRNVGVLRETLVDSGVGERLVALLRGDKGREGREREEVLCGALAATANILLELSPMKETLVRCAVLPLVVGYTQEPWVASVRLNALWALKNFAYRASLKHRKLLIEALTFSNVNLLTFADPIGDDDDACRRTVEVASLLNNLLVGADERVRQALFDAFPVAQQRHFIGDAVAAAKSGTAESQRAISEALNLLKSLHHACSPRYENQDSITSTLELARLAAKSLEVIVAESQVLSAARILDDIFSTLLKADPDAIQHLYDMGLESRITDLLGEFDFGPGVDKRDATGKMLHEVLASLAAGFAGWELKRATMNVDEDA